MDNSSLDFTTDDSVYIDNKKQNIKEDKKDDSDTNVSIFEGKTKDKEKLVLFSMEGCPHCVRFEKTWDKLVNHFNKEKNKKKFGGSCCKKYLLKFGKIFEIKSDNGIKETNNSKIEKKYDIKLQGFPTILYWDEGKKKYIEAETRDYEDIIDLVNGQPLIGGSSEIDEKIYEGKCSTKNNIHNNNLEHKIEKYYNKRTILLKKLGIKNKEHLNQIGGMNEHKLMKEYMKTKYLYFQLKKMFDL